MYLFLSSSADISLPKNYVIYHAVSLKVKKYTAVVPICASCINQHLQALYHSHQKFVIVFCDWLKHGCGQLITVVAPCKKVARYPEMHRNITF